MKTSFLRRIQSKITKNYILTTDDTEIFDITQTITKRYQNKFPDWEVLFISLPKNPAKREKALLQIVEFYRNHPEM